MISQRCSESYERYCTRCTSRTAPRVERRRNSPKLLLRPWCIDGEPLMARIVDESLGRFVLAVLVVAVVLLNIAVVRELIVNGWI